MRIVNGCGSTNSQLASLAVVNRALQIAGSNTVGGAAIALPVQLIGAGNETGVVFTIGFDPSVVSLTGVQPGTAASGTPTWSTVAAGQVRIAVFPTNAVFAAGVSELARVQFTVSSTVSNTMMPVVFVGTNAVTWDATGQGLVCSLEAGQVYVGGGMPVSATTNAATGFFDGTVTVVVPAGGIAAGQALRLLFYNLGVDAKGYPITIYNPSGAVTVAGLTNPVPYLQANGPLAAGPFSFTVHYMVVDRTTQPAPTFELQVVSVPFYQVTGSNVPVTMVYTTKRTVQLRFLTEVGKTNYIQYRSNLASNQIWNTVSPAIRGYGGGITNVWTDDGPPKTESSPSNAPIRFYRVLSNP